MISPSSSLFTSQGVVFATAMAVSGTVILLALRLQKSLPLDQISQQSPRSCISEGRKKKKKNKRVRFAEDVVLEPREDSKDFRAKFKKTSHGESKLRESASSMPKNRVALYNGLIKDRVGYYRLGY